MSRTKKTLRASEKRRVGRPFGIEDEPLFSARDYLLTLLEVNWGEVGWNLRNIKTSDEVPAALYLWKPESDLRPAVRALSRTVDRKKDFQKLSILRSEAKQLDISLRKVERNRTQCREFLDQADQALATELSEDDRKQISRMRIDRATALSVAQTQYESLNTQCNDIAKSVENAEAHFAQIELLRFCQSHRFRLNPLRTAKAREARTAFCGDINVFLGKVRNLVGRPLIAYASRRSETREGGSSACR